MRVAARLSSRFLPPTVDLRSTVNPTPNFGVVADPRSIERRQMFERLLAPMTSRHGYFIQKPWASSLRKQLLTPLRELYLRPELAARVSLYEEGNISLRLVSIADQEPEHHATYDIKWDPAQGLWFLTNKSAAAVYVARSPRLTRPLLNKISQGETTELLPSDSIRSHSIENHHLLQFFPPSISAEHALRLAGYDESTLYPPVITKEDDLETADNKIREALYLAEYVAAKYFPTPIDAYIPIDYDIHDPTRGTFFEELLAYRKTRRLLEERPLLRSLGIAIYKKYDRDGSLYCERCYVRHDRRFGFPPQLVLEDRQRVNNWQNIAPQAHLQLASDRHVHYAPWGDGIVLQYRNTAHGTLVLVDFTEARRVLWVAEEPAASRL